MTNRCAAHVFMVLAAAPSTGRFADEGPPPAVTPRFAGDRFAIAPGEVIVLAGGTEMAREQRTGWLETLLTAGFRTRRARFRNMAWEGDTVYAQPRNLDFGSWSDQLRAVHAGIVVARFGQMESLDGPDRLPDFARAYGQLLDQLSGGTRRLVLISPMPFEAPASPTLPDLSRRNQIVRRYADAVRVLARDRGAIFVDLFGPLAARQGGGALTSNGVHLTAEGQRIVAELAVGQMGSKPPPPGKVQALRAAVLEKNRLWFDCWRPMNWAFAFGSLTSQRFGKPAGKGPPLREELAELRPLVARADSRIWQLTEALFP